MCTDFCIHDKNNGNPHAHIMLAMRPFEQSGKWGAKTEKEYILDRGGARIRLKSGGFKTRKICATDWGEQTKAEEWRAACAGAVNVALERANHAGRVDHRSYARQGVEQIPTVHLGVAAFQMEKRGVKIELGDVNRAIEFTNSQLHQLRARISKLQNWLKEETENTKPLTLANVISDILSRRGQAGKPSYYPTINNLKSASQMLSFLQENRIMDMAGLQEKL
jgi:hypothetical protein